MNYRGVKLSNFKYINIVEVHEGIDKNISSLTNILFFCHKYVGTVIKSKYLNETKSGEQSVFTLSGEKIFPRDWLWPTRAESQRFLAEYKRNVIIISKMLVASGVDRVDGKYWATATKMCYYLHTGCKFPNAPANRERQSPGWKTVRMDLFAGVVVTAEWTEAIMPSR